MPASFASVRGANPVHPEMPIATLSWAAAGASEEGREGETADDRFHVRISRSLVVPDEGAATASSLATHRTTAAGLLSNV